MAGQQPVTAYNAPVPSWALAIVTVAVFRVTVALMSFVAGLSAPIDRPLAPLWVYAALSFAFTAIGLALVLSHRRDPRAGWLGAVLTMVGCPLVRPLVAGAADHPFAWLESLRPEVFTPACLWAFTACFPTALNRRPARAVRGITAACVAVGAVLLTAGAIALSGAETFQRLDQALNAVPRDRVSPLWLLVFGLSAPALFTLLWRSLRTADADRGRASLFIGALLVGVSPITLVVLAEGVWPRLADWIHRPPVEARVTGGLFAFLGTLPFTTAYAVLFDRVVETRVVLHVAAQYLLARYVVVLLTLIPFGGLFLYFVQHRHESLVVLFSGAARPTLLIGAAAAGAVALQYRSAILRALDRRYHREPYDGSRVLGELTGPDGPASVEGLTARVSQQLGEAFHAPVFAFFHDEEHAVLRAAAPGLPTLPLFSPLLRIGEEGEPIVDLSLRTSRPLLDGLGDQERRWIDQAQIRLVACVRSRVLGPVGLIAAGPKLSGLDYEPRDRDFLAAVASTLGVTFDSLRLHHLPQPVLEPTARECDGCGSVYPADATGCRCGRVLSEGRVPYVLRGVFRFERRIGSGGFGTVYRAVDLGLGRTVAIKLLTGARPDQVDALMREARNMAAVSHRHLAVIHAVERWRSTPLIVQEFLEGGTLARRLQGGPLPLREAAELGLVLADVLERLHGDGIVHCDVKPTNIGFTREGVGKLFDFGLARHTVPAASPDSGGTGMPGDGHEGLVGTPGYMSPEAIRGFRPEPGFDWWSLAVVLFEAFSGRRPFDGADTSDVLRAILLRPAPDPRVFRSGLPSQLTDVFRAAFDPARPRRLADARGFRAALTGLRAESGV